VKHWVYTEFTKLSTFFIILTQWLVHWEDIVDRFAGWLKLSHLIERRRQHQMNILEFPQFIKDVVQLANDVKSAQAVLAPQFPQLVADAEKTKEDGEKLLGINDIAVPNTTPAPPAAA